MVGIGDHPQEKSSKEPKLDEVVDGIEKEYYFISSLSSSITNSSELWLVENGTSRNIIGYQIIITNISERDSSMHVELGDDAKYVMRGIISTCFQLDSGDIIHIGDILFVA